MHDDELTERVLSVCARDVPTEYELTRKVEFSVSSGGKQLIEHEEISASRDFSFDETQLLAKEREQEILREALAPRSGGAGDAPAGGALDAMSARPESVDVLRVGPDPHPSLVVLTRRYGVELLQCATDSPPPGSYWGESEAGLRGNVLYVHPIRGLRPCCTS